MNDTELLQSFIGGSEEAFRSLVTRHLPLVFGTARRITGNNALAEDVTQTVFVLLARKAKSLSSATIVSGWLYRTTCFVSKRALTSEHRRQRREQEALSMDAIDDQPPKWEEVVPELDAALSALGEVDRTALILRFLQNQSMREVGIALGTSEDAAKKRVARALEKLRGVLGQRGIKVTASVLGAGLLHEGSAGAGTLTAIHVATSALGIAGGTLGGSALLAEVLGAMQTAKVKVIGAVAAVVLVALLSLTVSFTSSSSSGSPSTSPRNADRLAELKRSREARTNEPYNNPIAAGSAGTKADLVLTIVDRTTDKPVPGVRVLHPFLAPINNGPRPSLRSDAQGQVQISLKTPFASEEKLTRFELEVVAEEFASRTVSWICSTGQVLSTIPTNYTVKLDRGISLSGSITDEAGGPIRAARLRIWGTNRRDVAVTTSNGKVVSPPDVRLEDISSYTRTNVVSDEAGRFTLPDFPADLRRVILEVSTSDGVFAKFGTHMAKSLSAEGYAEVAFHDLQTGTARLVLRKGVTVAGKVVDAHGQAVPGATVVEGTQWGNLKILSENKTDAQGNFTLSNRAKREYILAASKAGYGSASVVVAAKENSPPVTIQLPRELPLRGRVVNAKGEAEAGAQVQVVDVFNEALGFNWSGQTDADGRFGWKGAPTNLIAFYISAQNSSWIVRLKPSPDEHMITLPESNTEIKVSGVAVDDETGKPISKFEVNVSYDMTGNQPDDPLKTVAGKDGAFNFVLKADEYGSGQMPMYILQITAEGYEPQVSRRYTLLEGDQELALRLFPEVWVEGVIMTSEGQPAAKAQYTVAAKGEPAFFNEKGRLDPRGKSALRTDASGRFRARKKSKDDAVVALHSSGWKVYPLESAGKKVEVELQPWSHIEGTVLLGGVAAPGEKVRVKDLIYDFLSPIMVFRETTADENGHFAFENMPPGNYEISLSSRTVINPDRTYVSVLQTAVKLGPAETKQVVLASSGVTVVGRLTMPGTGNDFNWTNTLALLSLDVQSPIQPNRGDFVSEEAHRAARIAFAHDPAVLAQIGKLRNYAGIVSEDGSVRFEHVPAGRYILDVKVIKESGEKATVTYERNVIGHSRVAIIVEEKAEGSEEASAISFGELQVDPI